MTLYSVLIYFLHTVLTKHPSRDRIESDSRTFLSDVIDTWGLADVLIRRISVHVQIVMIGYVTLGKWSLVVIYIAYGPM